MKQTTTLYLISICFFLMTYHPSVNCQNNKKYIGDQKLYYGVAYYPEAWDFETLDDDITLMKEANINVVRMSEFSWNLMEPEEGQFDFKWLHEVVDKLYENGIQSILGTPTATPPIWMATNYPEIFKVDADGSRRGHGSRKNTSYSSDKYRYFSERICTELGKEFGNKAAVIGWQTDNEFSLSPDYSEETRKKWVMWLKQKYQTIDQLNSIWATNLWSMEYQNFYQVPMAKPSVWHHPSLRMDWLQFTSDELVSFQKVQLDALRKNTQTPITHDAMPGQRIIYPDLFKELDFMATNFYHNFSVYNRVQINFDRLRGYGKGMHWVFETAPNYSGGGPKGLNWFIHQPNGAIRGIMWANYAMGGQGSLFWLWRQHPAGQEMVHGSFISAWGKKAANFEQLKELGQELKTHSDLLMNTPVDKSKIAIIYSHKAAMGFTIENASSSEIRYYTDWSNRFYKPMSDAFLHRDVIHERVDLSPYEIVVAPLLSTMSSEYIQQLKEWVQDGGTLILGPMSGYRTEHFTAPTNHALGEFGHWIGLEVESRIPVDKYSQSMDEPYKISFNLDNFETADCDLWSESLSSSEGKVLAKYTSGMHKDQAAIMETKVGKGKVVYLGTDPGYESMKKLYLKMAADKNIVPLATGDDGVIIVPRTGATGEYQFIVNISNAIKTIELTEGISEDIMTGKKAKKKKIFLQPYEVILGKN